MLLESTGVPQPSEVVSVAPAQPLNQRYLRWVNRVRTGIDALGGDPELINSLESLASMDDSSIRAWLTDFEARHGLITKDRTLEEIPEINTITHSVITEKERLLRFGVPRAAFQFIESKRKLRACNIIVDPSASFCPETANDPHAEFLNTLTAGCEFADAISELHRVIGSDAVKLSEWRAKEEARAAERRSSVEKQRRRRELLSDEPGGQWSTSLESMCIDISNVSQQLRESDTEVRRLREALAAAEQRRYTLAKNLRGLSESVHTVASKQRLLQFVADVRVDLEACSKETAEQRLKVIDSVGCYRSVVERKIVNDEFVNEVPILFDRLLESLGAMKFRIGLILGTSEDTKSVPNVPQQLVQLIRVGIELVRLWRQLHGAWAPLEMIQKIEIFEERLRKEHADVIAVENFSDFEANNDESHHSEPFAPQEIEAQETSAKFSNCTVFLYFNHLIHDTPAGHIESRKRLDTVVDVLMKREQLERAMLSRQQHSAMPGPTDGRAMDALCEGVKQLRIMSCPDASRPPEWVLPLVHAPSYLRRLQEMQDEATKDDLLVPLEFESDNYQSDEDDSSIVAARDKASAAANVKSENLALDTPLLPITGRALFDSVKLTAEDDPFVELASSCLSASSKSIEMLPSQGLTESGLPFGAKGGDEFGKMLEIDIPMDLVDTAIQEMEAPKKPSAPHASKQKRAGVDLSTDSYAFSAPVKPGRRGRLKQQNTSDDDNLGKHAAAILDSARPKYFPRKKWAQFKSQTSGVETQDDLPPEARLHNFSNEAVLKFVERAVAYAGTQRRVADFLGVGPSFMSQWFKSRRNNDLTKFSRIEVIVRAWMASLTPEERIEFVTAGDAAMLPMSLRRKIFVPPFVAGNAVMTPYGLGSVIESITPVHNEFAPVLVQLEWGAKAYMNPSDVELKAVVSAPAAAPSSTEVSETAQKPVVALEDQASVEMRPRVPIVNPNPYDDIFLDLMMQAITRTRKKMSNVHNELEQYTAFKMNRSYLSHWKHGLLTARVRHKVVPYVAAWLIIAKNALTTSQQEELDMIITRSIEMFPEFSELYTAAISSLIQAIEAGKYNYPYVVFKPTEVTCDESEKVSDIDEAAVNVKPMAPLIPHDIMPRKRGRPRKKARAGDPGVESIGGASFIASLSPALPVTFKEDTNVAGLAQPKSLHVQAIAGLFSLNASKQNKDNEEANRTSARQNDKVPQQKRDRENSNQDSGSSSESSYASDSQDESSVTATEAVAEVDIDNQQSKVTNRVQSMDSSSCKNSSSEDEEDVASSGGDDEMETDDQPVVVKAEVAVLSGEETEYDENINLNVAEDFDFEPSVSNEWIVERSEAPVHDQTQRDDDGNVSDATMSEVSEKSSDEDSPSNLNTVAETAYDLPSSEPSPGSVVAADVYNPNKHFGQCEACKKPGRLLLCDGCPCTYHLRCIVPKLMSVPENDWYCSRCVESGASLKLEIPDSEKNESLCNTWILIFLKSLRRWVPAYVITYSAKYNAFYCEYWRETKFKRTKVSQWLDISSCTVLRPSTLISLESRGFDIESQSQKPATRTKTIDGAVDQLEAMVDTYIGPDSFNSALCAAAVACRAVDVVMKSSNTNAFACIRPPGHHAGRYGFTRGCMSTGFCLLNNAAIAMVYSRVHWGLQRVAIIDIDVHFGNGTAELLRGDPMAFFACIHMIHGEENKGFRSRGIKRGPYADTSPTYEQGFYPNDMGSTELSDRYMSIGIFPKRFSYLSKPNANMTDAADAYTSLSGPEGFKYALANIVIPRLIQYDPELLIISAGFDGFQSDPIGGDLGLTLNDYTYITNQLRGALERPGAAGRGRVVSLMEGGYDTNPNTLGLAVCVENHVAALQGKNKS